MKRILFSIFALIFSLQALAYELVIIQSTSREKQTFITRTGTENGAFVGKRATFTTTNVSIVAKAIVATKEFTQWEIENDYTDIPFIKGDIVTMYDTKQYLWALNPDQSKLKYLKTVKYLPSKALEIHAEATQGLYETASITNTESVNRGGISTSLMFQNEVDRRFSYAIGFRYTKEVVNYRQASTVNQRFLGVGEFRYTFNPMKSFFDSQFSLGLGIGFGQSRSDTDGISSFGDAYLIPSSKIMLVFPTTDTFDFAFEASIDSLRTEEAFEDNTKQNTSMTITKAGMFWRTKL